MRLSRKRFPGLLGYCRLSNVVKYWPVFDGPDTFDGIRLAVLPHVGVDVGIVCHQVCLGAAVRHRTELERRREFRRVSQLSTSVKSKPKLISRSYYNHASIIGGSSPSCWRGQLFPSAKLPLQFLSHSFFLYRQRVWVGKGKGGYDWGALPNGIWGEGSSNFAFGASYASQEALSDNDYWKFLTFSRTFARVQDVEDLHDRKFAGSVRGDRLGIDACTFSLYKQKKHSVSNRRNVPSCVPIWKPGSQKKLKINYKND